MNPESRRLAFDTAVRLLARRNHTSLEIEQKLRKRGFDSEAIAWAVAECERLRYIDDEKTGRFYFLELKRKGCGPRRIRFQMKQKGLSGEFVEEMISGYEAGEEELEAARKALEKKRPRFDREPDARKRKEKMYRFLYSKGFSGEIISALLLKTGSDP